ncbi:MAG: HPrNtr [Ignavibacteria bacterium]|nr:HPrNtr [Ignavibacteria bacterium]
MVEYEVTIKNRAGMHTRPAAAVVKLAAKYKSEVLLIREGFTINAKSIIGVMTLAAEQGCKLMLRAEGPDETESLNEMVELFESGFGEM